MKSNLAIAPVPAEQSAQRQQVKAVIVGHVDHGKSTLVGRLLHDTGSLPDGKFEAITASCQRRGMPFEWSFLMDALQAERDQGITIDTAQIWFKTAKRDVVIIDAPGHKEFLKNMISGAASSDAAILLIDVHEGVKEQSKRHGFLLHLLGIRQIAVAVNKMDLIGYDEARFRAVEKEYTEYLRGIGVVPTVVVPIAAREGENIALRSAHMPWYTGPTVTEALDMFTPAAPLVNQPLRFPIQDVYKFDDRRILAGRIESGSLKVGDALLFSPGNQVVKVKSIEQWGAGAPPQEAHAGQSVGITLEDQIFTQRGDVASHVADAPKLSNTFRARVFWLGEKPLTTGKRYKLKLGTAEYQAEVKAIETIVNTDDLSRSAGTEVPRLCVGEVVLRLRGLAALDDFADNARTGRFVLVDGYDIAGGGIISLEGIADQRVAATKVKATNIFHTTSTIAAEQRAYHNGHLGGILWFTGLSGSGKSTLSQALQQRLFAKGYQVYVLDGDNVRRGLNSDLGFSHEDRAENIRRVGEVAALFADAGFIVITAFISPYREDRSRAQAAAPEAFHTVHIKASVEECERRDPKGLYQKARSGEIKQFTGVTDPYEEPENSDVVVDTAAHSIDECVDQLVAYVEQNLVQPVRLAVGNFEASSI